MLPISSSMRRHRRRATTPVSTLRSAPTIPATVPRERPSDPSLLHRRAAGADLLRAPAPSDAAAKDGEKEEAANPGGDADDDTAVF